MIQHAQPTVYGGCQLMWMGSFLDELEIEKDRPFTIWCDNNSTINLMKTTKGPGKSKHFALDYHWIHKAVQLRDHREQPCRHLHQNYPKATCDRSLMPYKVYWTLILMDINFNFRRSVKRSFSCHSTSVFFRATYL